MSNKKEISNKDKTLVVVLGMHRSGTSVMTKALETLNVSLGTELLDAGRGNTKGHWEDLNVLAINERLLNLAGLNWHSVGPLPLGLLESDGGQQLIKEAVALVNSRLEQLNCWGFKDPRTARLLEFWLKVFEKSGVTPRFLFAIRNPLDVYQSHHKRDNFFFDKCQHLWLLHSLPNIDLVKDYLTCVVDYAEFIDEPASKLDVIAETLSLEKDEQAIASFAEEFLDKSLCHSQASLVELAGCKEADPLLVDSYRLLHAVASQKASFSDFLDNHAASLAARYQGFNKEQVSQLITSLDLSEQMVGNLRAELSIVDTLKDELVQSINHSSNLELEVSRLHWVDGKLQTAQQHIKTLESAIDSFEQSHTELSSVLHQTQIESANREQQLAAQAAQLAEQAAQVAHLNRHIQAMYNSTTWALGKPLRGIKKLNSYGFQALRKVQETAYLHGGYSNLYKKTLQVYKQEGLSGLTTRVNRLGSRQLLNQADEQAAVAGETGLQPYQVDYPSWLALYGEVTPERAGKYKADIQSFSSFPVISILMPVYNVPEKYLREALDSVVCQLYPHWELCIADDKSPSPHIRTVLEEYAAKESRIKLVFREENGHISAATNSALEVASSDHIALMDHDDLLTPDALYWVAKALSDNPEIAMLYTDEDKLSEDGSERYAPYFKSDWNPDLFLSQNCICHLGVYRTDIAREIGGFSLGLEGAQDWDFALRFSESIEPSQIHHIPRICYHWRSIEGSTAVDGDEKPYALIAGQNAVNNHLERIGAKAKAEPLPDFAALRVRFELPEEKPMVSLIIPTRNGLDFLEKCINSIYEKTTYPNFEILLVDNGSDDPATLEFLKAQSEQHDNFHVIEDSRPFNYSALNNNAVEQAKGELIALVNNDVEIITPEWLDEMVSHAIRPEIGAVGARLWYDDMTLQHGGIMLLGGVAGHAHKYFSRQDPGYFGRAWLTQNFVGVTAACLVIKKSIFEEVGGLNEQDLTIAFNDVDFCLKVHTAGYRNLWTPFAELFHYESKTRGFEDTPEKQARFQKEIDYMQSQWGELIARDPYYNPNLYNGCENFSIAGNPLIEY